MKEYSLNDLGDALSDVGLIRDDIVLVHSGLFSLGRLTGVEPSEMCREIYGVFREVIGPGGTLLVPAFFYEYARRGEVYDTRSSPVSRELGVFPRWVTFLPEAVRSYNPLTCLAAMGPSAKDICRRGVATAYGYDSPWDRLTVHNAKMLFLGTSIRKSMTYIHYIEECFGVPHMYHKYHDAPIYDDGISIDLPVITYVRYLDYGIKTNLGPFENQLKKIGVVAARTVGMGSVECVQCSDVFREGIRMLKKNVFFMLEKVPEFVSGMIPTDGLVS